MKVILVLDPLEVCNVVEPLILDDSYYMDHRFSKKVIDIFKFAHKVRNWLPKALLLCTLPKKSKFTLLIVSVTIRKLVEN